MNILYISKLLNSKATGLYWSVPRQIAAQSKYDTVFWYNINHNLASDWKELFPCYTINEYPELVLDKLPTPFNLPDLVIFEGFYEYGFNELVYEIWSKRIPYIIVPRCSLTCEAQKIKHIKKVIGNFLFFSKFASRALAIQYLTENEYKSSTDKWNNRHIVISNGITVPHIIKQEFSTNTLRGLYIGRIATFHKGLDLLIDACAKIQDELRAARCSITLYGPNWNNDEKQLIESIRKRRIQDILIAGKGPVYDENKEKILLDYDFFVLTSRLEGHPMGLLEALSYGLPVLVTEGSNMGHEIQTFNAGWVSSTTVDGIVNSLRRLISERYQLKLKSQNAITLAKQYNWDNLAQIASRVYKDLIK